MIVANELLFESHSSVVVLGAVKVEVKFTGMKLEENSGVRGKEIPVY